MSRRSRQPKTRAFSVKRAAILTLVAGLFGGGVFAANRFQVRRNADGIRSLARAAADRGDHGEAGKLYANYLNFQPKDIDALVEYAGIVKAETELNPKAVRSLAEIYERLLRVAPERQEERKKLVELYLNGNYAEGARDHIEYLLDADRGGAPNDPTLLGQLAACDVWANRPEAAAESLRKAVATKAAPADAYLALADLLKDRVRSKEAAEESAKVLDQLLADKPGDALARVARVRYLFREGRTDEAKKDLEAARTAVPGLDTNPDAVPIIAELAMASQDFDRAKSLLETAAAANPKDAKLQILLAEVFVKQKSLPRAREALEAASRLLPEHGTLVLEVIDRKIDFGMLAAAEKDTARFADREKYRAVHDYLTGRLKLAGGDWPAALPKLLAAAEALDKLPLFAAKAHSAAAQCYRHAQNPDRMLAEAAAALKLDPTLAPAALTAAEAQVMLGRWDAAEPTLRRFADRVPEARAALVRRAFADEVAKPMAARNWAAFEESLGKPPYPTELVVLHARSFAARGQPEKGAALLAAALKENSNDALLRVAAAATDRAATSSKLDEAVKQVGDRVEFRLAKLQLLADANADAAALAAVADKPADFTPAEKFLLYAGLGDVFAKRRNDPANAAKFYSLAAAQDPHHLPVRIALFEIAAATGDATAAIAEVRKLEGPDGPVSLLGEVVTVLRTNPPREKLPALRPSVDKVLAVRGSWAKARGVSGELHDRLGDADAAVADYRRAFELGDRSDPLVRRLVQLLAARNRFDDAKRVLDSREKAGVLPGDLRMQLAWLDTALGQNEKPTAAALTAAEGSKDPAEQLFRGQTLLLAGKPADAAKAFEAAVALKPDFGDGWVSLVRSYGAAGKPDDAKAAAARAEKATTLSPLAKGQLKELTGDAAAAEAAYRAALQAAPGDPAASRLLFGVLQRAGRLNDCVPVLKAVLDNPAAAASQPWARRSLAFTLADLNGGHRKLDECVALIDENLKSGQRAEDLTAKALVLAGDPYRRAEVKRLLSDAAKLAPPTADEALQIARLHLQENDPAAAEDTLTEATRSAALAVPEHLAVLHRIQVQRGRGPAAKATLEKLKKAAPGSWPAVAEEARALAKDGKKADAEKMLLAFPADEATWLGRVVPMLVDVGCAPAAEKYLSELPENRGKATLAFLYAGSGKSAEAVRTAKELPPAVAARAMTAAVAGLAPDAKDRDAVLADVAAWGEGKLKAAPADRDLLTLAGVVADARGNYDDAVAKFEAAVAAGGAAVAARNNLAYLLAVHKKDAGDRPLELVAQAVEAAGPRASLLDTRGVVLLGQGKASEAVREFEAAAGAEPKGVYYFHLALAHEKLNSVARLRAARDAATRAGLTKAAVHPKEWGDYERLFGK